MSSTLPRWILLIFVFALTRQVYGEEWSRDQLLVRIERAIKSGTTFLLREQSDDGSWRSTTYGLLKDGTSLTPLVASAIGDEGDAMAARNRALNWMSTWFVRDGQEIQLSHHVQYPVYAAGLCVPLLRRHGSGSNNLPKNLGPLTEIDQWIKRVQALQLNSANGWSSDDVQYGGWGYSHEPPQKPERGAVLSPLDEPNLSATVFALEALLVNQESFIDSDRSDNSFGIIRQAALRFVSRCQNLRETGLPIDSRFNDGGFHFIMFDPVRNKPGVAGIDSRGETRFLSYGSATADGLRALLLCGVDPRDRRVVAARNWLLDHFKNGSHPGAYPDDRSSLKPSLDFYYANSVARAFQAVQISEDEPLGRGEWGMRLSKLLISRQQSNGCWINPAVDVREDDPLVATPLALRSLQICRDELRRETVQRQ